MINSDIQQRRGSKNSMVFHTQGNLEKREISFVVKPSTEITDSRIIDKNSLRTGEIGLVYNQESGKTDITVYILEEDTYSLKEGNYFYDLDDLSVSDTIAGGVFMLTADVQTPFDNLAMLPLNCPRGIILMPDDYGDNEFVYKISVDGKSKFAGISFPDTKRQLGIEALENNKVDKETGKGLSENNFTGELKTAYDAAANHVVLKSNPHEVTKEQVGLGSVANADTTDPANINQSSQFRFVTDSEKTDWNLAYTDKHSHSNKAYIDVITQNLTTASAPQFVQLGLGRAALSSWSLALQAGLTTKSGTYLDWEGGNARIRENAYALEYTNYDGSALTATFKMSASGNYSYKPFISCGQAYKVVSASSNMTASNNDHIILVTTSSTAKTITLPVAGITDGTVYTIKKTDSEAGAVIVQPASGTIDGQSSYQITAQYGTAGFVKYGANYFILWKST